MAVNKLTKRNPRKIMVQSEFNSEVYRLFLEFSGSLSDGYWEGEEYHDEIWNCFDFDTNSDSDRKGAFCVVLKAHPTCENHKRDTEKFFAMSDKDIIEYLKSALIESIEEYPEAFHYSDYELDILKQCVETAKVLPPALPKINHEELMKIVGHDFEYEK